MKRHQYQFDTDEERMRRVKREMFFYILKFVGYAIIWVLFLLGSLAAIGWIAAHGRMYNW